MSKKIDPKDYEAAFLFTHFLNTCHRRNRGGDSHLSVVNCSNTGGCYRRADMFYDRTRFYFCKDSIPYKNIERKDIPQYIKMSDIPHVNINSFDPGRPYCNEHSHRKGSPCVENIRMFQNEANLGGCCANFTGESNLQKSNESSFKNEFNLMRQHSPSNEFNLTRQHSPSNEFNVMRQHSPSNQPTSMRQHSPNNQPTSMRQPSPNNQPISVLQHSYLRQPSHLKRLNIIRSNTRNTTRQFSPVRQSNLNNPTPVSIEERKNTKNKKKTEEDLDDENFDDKKIGQSYHNKFNCGVLENFSNPQPFKKNTKIQSMDRERPTTQRRTSQSSKQDKANSVQENPPGFGCVYCNEKFYTKTELIGHLHKYHAIIE